MASERQESAQEYLQKFGQMTLDEVAVQAATNPGSVYSQAAEIEMKRRVASAQIEAAEAQTAATVPLRTTARATVALAVATFILALATAGLALLTYCNGNAPG
jgi:hypothetical protein